MNIFRTLFGGRKSSTEEKQNEEQSLGALKDDGVRALKQRQFERAVQCFASALQANAADLECRDYLSRAYAGLGDLGSAYEQLQQIAEARPGDTALLMRMAEMACAMKNYTAMSDACEKALLLDGNNAQVYYLYAKACRGLGDAANTVAMLTRAISLDSGFSAARQLLGEVLREYGDSYI